VGIVVSEFTEAIAWDGVEATAIVFLIHPEGQKVEPSVPAALTQPKKIRFFALEEDENERILGDRVCSEYSFVYDDVPSDVDGVIRGVLQDALDGGAQVAWAAFEGSFSFDHLLTSDIAEQVYAVADSSGVHLAIDDEVRSSADWTDRVTRLGTSVTG